MRFSKPQKYLALATITMAAIIGGGYAWLSYSLQHMQFDFGGLNVLVGRLTATVEIATLTVPRCASPPEYPAVGNQRREAMMLYVATVIDLYKTTFGKLPESIADLDKLPSFNNADRLNDREIKKSCSIYGQPAGSYVLACGGSSPPAKKVEAISKNAGRVQRFYLLGGIEALYVPADPCP
jgi:hypothetical protein